MQNSNRPHWLVLGFLRLAIPWQRDQARRRVRATGKLVTMLEEALSTLRRSEAEERLQQVLDQCRRFAEEMPELSDVASETEGLANNLLGPEGVELQS